MNTLDIIEFIAKVKKEKILKQMQFKRPGIIKKLGTE